MYLLCVIKLNLNKKVLFLADMVSNCFLKMKHFLMGDTSSQCKITFRDVEVRRQKVGLLLSACVKVIYLLEMSG